MIKKQLGLLAGSVILASSANAAITLDGNSLAVFNTAGAGTYLQLIPGSTGIHWKQALAFQLTFLQQLRHLADLSNLLHYLH